MYAHMLMVIHGESLRNVLSMHVVGADVRCAPAAVLKVRPGDNRLVPIKAYGG